MESFQYILLDTGHPSSNSWLNTKSLWLEINDKGHGDDIQFNDVLGTATTRDVRTI